MHEMISLTGRLPKSVSVPGAALEDEHLTEEE